MPRRFGQALQADAFLVLGIQIAGIRTQAAFEFFKRQLEMFQLAQCVAGDMGGFGAKSRHWRFLGQQQNIADALFLAGQINPLCPVVMAFPKLPRIPRP